DDDTAQGAGDRPAAERRHEGGAIALLIRTEALAAIERQVGQPDAGVPRQRLSAGQPDVKRHATLGVDAGAGAGDGLGVARLARLAPDALRLGQLVEAARVDQLVEEV